MKNYRIISRSLEFQEDAITTYMYIILCIELNLTNLCKTIAQNIYTTAERIQWLCTLCGLVGGHGPQVHVHCTYKYRQVPHGISF